MRLHAKTFIILSITFLCAFIITVIFLSKFIINGYVREESNYIPYYYLALLFIGLILILIIWIILEKQIISRITLLGTAVSKIGSSNDNSSRISLPGKDVVSNLANNINGMLDKLETQNNLHKENETFNLTLLENSPNPVEVINPDGSIRYINPALEKLTGFSKSQLLGRKPPYPWWFTEYAQQYNTELIEDMNSEVHKRERHLHKQNGESFWVEITSATVKQEDTIEYFISNWVDITERKINENALRESEKRFRELAQLLPELVFETDSKGIIKYVNQVALSVFGYSSQENIGMELIDFVANGAKEVVSQYFKDVVNVEALENIEFTAIRKDGRRFPAFIHATRITNLVNEVSGVRGIIVDISAQKKIEADLRASEEFSTNLLKNASYPIIVINSDTSIQYVNPAMEGLTGYTSAEVIGLKIPYPWFQQNRALHVSPHDYVSSDKDIKGQERHYYKKNGQQFWITLTVNTIRNNGIIKYIVENWVDITERKKAADALRESERFSSILQDNSPYPIMVINPDRSIKYVNKALQKISGYAASELEGQFPPYLFWFKDHSQQKENYPVDKFTISRRVEPFQRKNGESFWVENTSTPIMEGLNLKYILSIWIDITAQKLTQEELETLYHREKNLREALQTEIRGRTEFTRALVHELKTPLTPILVSSELLVEELTEDPLMGLAKNIHQGAQNMNKRVDELLDMARGEVGILKINRKSIDPEKLIKEIFNYMEPATKNAGQTLVLNIPEKLPIIKADEDRIRQVILNLVDNSIKYSNGNGTITITAKIEMNNLVIEIQDSGRGMSKEEQEILFQPYYRIDGKQHLSGLGLSLALSKQFIELHKGRMWVKSQKGVGSTFYLSLPLKIN
jgi:two-component system, sensor histidine kinase